MSDGDRLLVGRRTLSVKDQVLALTSAEGSDSVLASMILAAFRDDYSSSKVVDTSVVEAAVTQAPSTIPTNIDHALDKPPTSTTASNGHFLDLRHALA